MLELTSLLCVGPSLFDKCSLILILGNCGRLAVQMGCLFLVISFSLLLVTWKCLSLIERGTLDNLSY